MRHLVSSIHWAVVAAAGLTPLTPIPVSGQPVIFSVNTHRGNDTLYVGERAFISFDVDGQGAQIQGLVFPLEFSFGAGSLMGAMPDDVALDFDLNFQGGFGGPQVDPVLHGTDPDTLLVGMTPWGGPWITSGPQWAIRAYFQPKAPGQIVTDSIFLPPANTLAALNPFGQIFEIEWHSPAITVLPCPNILGDVNQNGQVTSADIILFVNCVFLCDPGPHDIWDLGDVNCNGVATVADVIHMVNYVFKSMPLPFCCNVLD